VLGGASLLKKVKQLEKAFDANRDLAVKESTLAIHGEAIKIVSANAGGTSAVRYNPRRNVSVSRPGDPPHTDTGRLRQSIKFEYSKGIGKVGSNLKYAAWLEFGTEDMAPRPWLSVAVEKSAKRVAEIFEKWFKNAVKEGTS
jgi:HK97 gp10 family phage protein